MTTAERAVGMTTAARAAGQARLDGCARRDQARAREIARTKGRGGGLKGSVSREAFMNAVATEGPEVAQDRGYWRDMERRYPWMNAAGRPTDTGDSPDGSRNRHGRVGYRARWDAERGRLVRERRVRGRWVEA